MKQKNIFGTLKHIIWVLAGLAQNKTLHSVRLSLAQPVWRQIFTLLPSVDTRVAQLN